MLELIRKYANSIVVKIFLTILAGSFFLFFGFSYIVDRIKGRDYVIKIANTKISPQAFKIERMKKLEMLQRISPNKVDDSQVTAGIVHQLVWDNIIDLAYLFNGCISLTELPDISKWNTNNVTNIICMFASVVKCISH